MEPFGMMIIHQGCIEHGSDVGLFGILAPFCTMGYDITCTPYVALVYVFDGIGLCVVLGSSDRLRA